MNEDITCDTCNAACCQSVALIPPYHEDEIDHLPEELKEELRAIVLPKSGEPLEPCIFLDQQTNRCRHYAHRPKECVDYQLGGQMCRTTRGLGEMELVALRSIRFVRVHDQ